MILAGKSQFQRRSLFGKLFFIQFTYYRKFIFQQLFLHIFARRHTFTARDAMQKEKVAAGRSPHSHEGAPYTSPAYLGLSQEYHFKPSMSSPGCPYGNAAMENFFGTLKTEYLYRMTFNDRSPDELAVAASLQFYNFERINLKNGLTPLEIRSKAA